MVFKAKAKSQIKPQIITLQCLTQFYTICNSCFATLTFTMCFTWQKKNSTWVKTHDKVAKIFVTLYCFQRYHFQGKPFSTMSLIWKIFTMFLHMMVGQNPHKQMPKKLHFKIFIWCEVKVYLCQKTRDHNVLKNANIFKKWLKWFLIFMKFILFTKHCDSIWLEHVCEPCEEFDNSHI
jgi:hypothetical protein